MRSSNPALTDKVFASVTTLSTDRVSDPRVSMDQMTIGGTVNKSFILLALVLSSSIYAWDYASLGVTPPWFIPLILSAFGVSLVIIFKRTTAPYLAPVYALLEGGALGLISGIYEMQYQGIVPQAVLCTIGTFLSLLIAYKSRLIKVTENFKLGLFAATGGIAIVYLINFIMSFFGKSIPMIHESGAVGIGFSVFVVIIAALNLVMDFDFIEHGAKRGAPKYMEWYAAFGLLVTLVWLYLEIIRLLGKSRRR